MAMRMVLRPRVQVVETFNPSKYVSSPPEAPGVSNIVLNKGDVVLFIELQDDDWAIIEKLGGGGKGIVPVKCLQELPAPDGSIRGVLKNGGETQKEEGFIGQRSGPQNVVHVGHIGFSESGFEAQNLPPQLQTLFHELNEMLLNMGVKGITKKEAKFLLNVALSKLDPVATPPSTKEDEAEDKKKNRKITSGSEIDKSEKKKNRKSTNFEELIRASSPPKEGEEETDKKKKKKTWSETSSRFLKAFDQKGGSGGTLRKKDKKKDDENESESVSELEKKYGPLSPSSGAGGSLFLKKGPFSRSLPQGVIRRSIIEQPSEVHVEEEKVIEGTRKLRVQSTDTIKSPKLRTSTPGLEKIKAQLQQTEQKLAQQVSFGETLTSELERKDVERETLEKALVQKEDEIKELILKTQEKQNDVLTMLEDKKSAEAEMNRKEKEMQMQIEQLNNKLMWATQEVKEKEKIIKEKDEGMVRMEKQSSELLNQKSIEFQELKTKMTNLKEKNEEDQKKIELLKKQLKDEKILSHSLQSRINVLEIENSELRLIHSVEDDQSGKVRDEVIALLQQYKAKWEKAEEEKDGLARELDILKSTLEKSQEEEKNLQQAKSDLTQKLVATKEELLPVKTQCKASEEENKKIKIENEELRNIKSGLKMQLQSGEIEVQRLKMELSEASSRIKNLEKDIKSYSKVATNLEQSRKMIISLSHSPRGVISGLISATPGDQSHLTPPKPLIRVKSDSTLEAAEDKKKENEENQTELGDEEQQPEEEDRDRDRDRDKSKEEKPDKVKEKRDRDKKDKGRKKEKRENNKKKEDPPEPKPKAAPPPPPSPPPPPPPLPPASLFTSKSFRKDIELSTSQGVGEANKKPVTLLEALKNPVALRKLEPQVKQPKYVSDNGLLGSLARVLLDRRAAMKDEEEDDDDSGMFWD